MRVESVSPLLLTTTSGRSARIALVHDLLTQLGGAEHVLDVLHALFPQAPVFVLARDMTITADRFEGWDIRESSLARLPGGVKRYKWYLPLLPSLVEQHDLSAYDLVVSNSSAFAKGVLTQPGTVHVSYCHSPTRYLWSDTHEYVRELSNGRFVKRGVKLMLSHLRQWDYLAAQRADVMVANSYAVQKRIQHYYGRASSVVHPPIETRSFEAKGEEERGQTGKINPAPFFLIVTRLRPHKRVDLAIQACNQLGATLVVAGSGEDEARLKALAGPSIRFEGNVSDERRNELMRTCQAFLYPQEEDFGLTAVEAMASGAPVIAYGKGGACETVVQGVTGQLFYEQTADALAKELRSFDRRIFNSERIMQHASKFSVESFVQGITGVIQDAWHAKHTSSQPGHHQLGHQAR